jgi:hypothetical protein
VVLFLGKTNNTKSEKMPSFADLGYFKYQYKIVNISDIDYKVFLKKPETFVLAILGKYEEKNLKKVLKAIMDKAKEFLRTKQQFNDLAQDLEIIAKLRNLQQEVQTLIPTIMPVVFDVTQSSGYQKGKLEGKLEIAKALITFGELSLDKIAQATGLTLEQIKALEQEVKKEKKEKK